MRRLQALFALAALLLGILPGGAQPVRACQEVVRSCPMAVKMGGRSKPCCCEHKETPTLSSVAPAGCCTIQKAPERPDTAAMLTLVDAPVVALASPGPSILAPAEAPVLVTPVSPFVPPLRGPPGARRSPRAPPFIS